MHPSIKQQASERREIESLHSPSPRAANNTHEEMQMWAGLCTSPMSVGAASWTEEACSSVTEMDSETREWVTCMQQLLHNRRGNQSDDHCHVRGYLTDGLSGHATTTHLLQQDGSPSHLWRNLHSDTSPFREPFSARCPLTREPFAEILARAGAATANYNKDRDIASDTSGIVKSAHWHVALTAGVSKFDESGDGFRTIECPPPQPSAAFTQLEYASIISHLAQVVSPLSYVIHAIFYHDARFGNYLPLTHDTVQYATTKYRLFVIPASSHTPYSDDRVVMPLPGPHDDISTCLYDGDDAPSASRTISVTMPSVGSIGVDSDSPDLPEHDCPVGVVQAFRREPRLELSPQRRLCRPAVSGHLIEATTRHTACDGDRVAASVSQRLQKPPPWPSSLSPSIYTYAPESIIDTLEREIVEGMDRLWTLSEELPAADEGRMHRLKSS